VANLLQQFKSLLPGVPLLVGEVTAVNGHLRTVMLPDGATLTARGDGTLGQNVFVRAGAIEGAAPALPLVEIVL